MSKHTPGDWKIRESKKNTHEADSLGMVVSLTDNLLITKEDGTKTHGFIALVNGNYKANAHLIASAPELLEACKEAIILITKDLKGVKVDAGQVIAVNFTQQKLEQAIAKAERGE